jgi:hypothetical protein
MGGVISTCLELREEPGNGIFRRHVSDEIAELGCFLEILHLDLRTLPLHSSIAKLTCRRCCMNSRRGTPPY